MFFFNKLYYQQEKYHSQRNNTEGCNLKIKKNKSWSENIVVDCIYNIQQPHHTQSDPDDVIEHEKMNSFLCSCDKCFHWEKYKECKICNAENICSNEEMDENYKENNSETDENQNSTFEEEQKLLKENELTH